MIDDSIALQQMLDAGVPMLVKPVYNCATTLRVSSNLDMNGCVIKYTGTDSAIDLTAGELTSSVPGAEVQGQSNIPNPDGVSGINASANTRVTKIRITNFQKCGIYSGSNNPYVDSCTIDNIGYIGFFFDGEGANTFGGTFTNNTVDCSMVPNPIQKPVQIQGSLTGNGVGHNWNIQNNTITAALNPANIDVECMEVRQIKGSRIKNNVFTGGSIGCSMVGLTTVHSFNNKAVNCSNEGFEFAGVINGYSNHDTALGGPLGFLLDGGAGNNITINNFTSTATMGIQVYTGITNVTIDGANITCTSQAVYITNATEITVNECLFNGKGFGDFPITIESSPGGFTMNGGTVTGFVNGLVNATGGAPFTISNVNTNDVVLSKTASGLGLYNATVGTNVNVQ